MRESNDFGLSIDSSLFGNDAHYDGFMDQGEHGRLSKWSADNKARFLSDLDNGKAGDWIVSRLSIVREDIK